MNNGKMQINTSFFKKIIICVAVLTVLVVGSIVHAIAQTVPCTVIDGENKYEFKLNSPSEEDIINTAVENGMTELGANDKYVFSDGVINIDRSFEVLVNDQKAIAYKNDTIKEILDRANVDYNDTDLITPVLSNIVMDDTKIVIKPEMIVTLSVDGVVSKITMHDGNVNSVLMKEDIVLNEADIISLPIYKKLKPEMVIEITKAKKVNLSINDEEKEYYTQAQTVQDLLDELEIELVKGETVSCAVTDTIENDMDVDIVITTYKKLTNVETIEYMVKYIADPNLSADESYTKVKGVDGEKTIYYTEAYIGDKLVTSNVDEEKITKASVTEIIVRGTKGTEGNTFVDASGNLVSFKSKMIGECTAYCIPGGTTSTGLDAQVGVVAVDPKVIPYGTRMYITSGSIVYGYAVAGDTGGAAMSGRILVDLYYNTVQEAIQFGRRDMTVYILD